MYKMSDYIKMRSFIVGIEKRDIDRLQKLVDEGMDVNLRPKSYDLDGCSFLSRAIWYGPGHINVVKFLIENGADPNLQNLNSHEWTSFQMACMWSDLKILKYLISKGADPRVKSGFVNCQLIISLHSRDPDAREMVRYLDSLKGPLSLQHITLNLIEKEGIPRGDLPDVLFQR